MQRLGKDLYTNGNADQTEGAWPQYTRGTEHQATPPGSVAVLHLVWVSEKGSRFGPRIHPAIWVGRMDSGGRQPHLLSVCVFRHTMHYGFDQGLTECRNIIWFSAEDKLAVRHDRLINPRCSGILDIGFQ